MADTTTPILELILPEIGGSRNTWGQKLHDNFTALDTEAGDVRERLDEVEGDIPALDAAKVNNPVGVNGGAASGNVVVDFSTGEYHRFTLGAAANFTFSNLPASRLCFVYIRRTGSGTLSFTFPGSAGQGTRNVSAPTDTSYLFGVLKLGDDVLTFPLEVNTPA